MSESPEHSFLKNAFLEQLHLFSAVQLFGMTEAARKQFDLACTVTRDWDRLLVGQVGWRHKSGLDKDIRTLALDHNSEIRVLLLPQTMSHMRVFAEAMDQLRTSDRFPDLFKLRPIWLPHDFDADNSSSQGVITTALRHAVVDDLLFNVVFGRLSRDDMRHLLDLTGRIGMAFAVLHRIATGGFLNLRQLGEDVGTSSTPLRERLGVLTACGFLEVPTSTGRYAASTKGRVFLELLRAVQRALDTNSPSNELAFLLDKLGCPWSADLSRDAGTRAYPSKPFGRLRAQLRDLRSFDVDIRHLQYQDRWPDLAIPTTDSQQPSKRTRRPITAAQFRANERRARQRARQLEDMLVRLLTGRSLSVEDVAKAALKAGFRTRSQTFRTTVNMLLIKSPKFAKVARGMYTARAGSRNRARDSRAT